MPRVRASPTTDNLQEQFWSVVPSGGGSLVLPRINMSRRAGHSDVSRAYSSISAYEPV